MPDLSQTAARAWLRQIEPAEASAAWPPPIRAIEDQGDAPGLWVELGECLDQIAAAGPGALTQALGTASVSAGLRLVLAQAGAARVFRFIHWVGQNAQADSYTLLAAVTEGGSPEATALRATITGFGRRATLSRIFAPERVEALHAATELAMTETQP